MKNRFKLLVGAAAIALAFPAFAADVRPDPDLMKNSPAFKKAFEPIVAKAAKSTVEVLSDGKRVVLGTIVTADGYILTKASELKGKITVRRSGTEIPAKLIGVVPVDDLAMIKIEDKDLPAVTWAADAEIKKIEPGDWVAVSAASAERPVAIGIISLGRREIPPEAPALGVSLSDADNGKGARITQVIPGSGAEKAGVHVDDTITSINGKAVKSRTDLTDIISKQRPGDVIKIIVSRGGKDVELSATLGVRGAVFSALDPRLQMQNLLLGPVSARASAFPIVLQHDAVLRPTECGGPLINVEGKIIGLNIARAGRTESYAIPADIVVPLMKDLIAGKFAPVSATAAKAIPTTSITPSTTPSSMPATSTAPATMPAK